MHMNNYTKAVLGFFAAAAIASCSMSTHLDAEIEREIETATKLKEESKTPGKPIADDIVRVKNDIWLGDKSQVEYEGEPLPSYLEGKDGVTLISNRPITLFEIGDMITKITSVGVRYASHLEKDIRDMAKENKPDPETINADWTEPDKMLVSYKGPLSGLLDEIATRFGIWWKYEKGQIYFYKYESRTFVLYSLPTKPSLSVSMGGSSSGESGNASTTLSSQIDVALWDNIEKAITSMISGDSKLTMDPANGTISVLATPIEVKRIAKFINEQNARLSRQVAISVKVLQVQIADNDTYGLDLKATFKDGVNNVVVAGSTSVSTAENAANMVSWGILKGNWTADAAVRALSTQNNTSLVTSGTVTTLNNKPAPIQVTQKQNYIAEMTKTNSGTDGNNYDISVTTEEIETGFTLDVLPRILEHGRMLLMFNMTLSDLLSLEKVEFGNADDNQYIQNPKVESRAFTQEVAMTSGESLILTGFEKVSNSTTKEGTGSATNSLLGGSATATKDRSVLVIILTPVILDTPLVPESRMSMN